MSIIDMRQFCIKQLNALPPCSRKRAGIVHILQQINKADLERMAELQREDERASRECEMALDEALQDPAFRATMGMV